MTRKNAVPVGATPIPKYATWDEHRVALTREAEENRKRRMADRR